MCYPVLPGVKAIPRTTGISEACRQNLSLTAIRRMLYGDLNEVSRNLTVSSIAKCSHRCGVAFSSRLLWLLLAQPDKYRAYTYFWRPHGSFFTFYSSATHPSVLPKPYEWLRLSPEALPRTWYGSTS
jgi:hypothetical protein